MTDIPMTAPDPTAYGWFRIETKWDKTMAAAGLRLVRRGGKVEEVRDSETLDDGC